MERLGVAFTGSMAPTSVVECVKLAETLGYESAWVGEGHGGDQFTILTACALATDRILLGTSITSVFVRSAPTIAMAAACVDQFSDGRFILGLGTSHKMQVEPEHGLEFSQPIQRLRECIDITRGLLRDGVFSYKGQIYDIESFDLWFKPLRREIPIYVAAVFPKMLEISGEISQGAMLTRCTTEQAGKSAEHVATGARRAGKNLNEVDVAMLAGCAVSADKNEARDALRPNIASYAARFPRYRRLMAEAGFAEELETVRRAWEEGDTKRATRLLPADLIDQVALVGAPEECRRRLEEYRSAGITLPIISPRGIGPDPEAAAMEVIEACAPR